MIKELHEKIINQEFTATELTQRYLDTIEEKNTDINAYLDIYKEGALRQAQLVDNRVAAGEEIGMLEGIPCAIKDNICMRGKRTTAGSKFLDNYVEPYDATVMQRLNDQGAVVLGKTNMDEFAMGSSTENSAYGVTKNPYDLSRVAGGSSGGSAAAVAADMAVWALGSDTGGSIRQPASLCGTVGVKPTYGRVSRYGLIAMASSYDQIGTFTKTVEDAAIALDVICGRDEKDNTSIEKGETKFFERLNGDLRGKKIGIVKDFFENGLDENIKKAVLERVAYAASQGAKIVDIELPHSRYALGVYYLMITSEISSNMARFDGIKYGMSAEAEKTSLLDVYLHSRQKGLGAEVKRRIILGTYALSSGYYDAYYKKAQKVRELIKKDFQQAFSQVDVLISPTSPTTAFKISEKTENPLEMYLADIYTVSVNVAGIPAMSIPGGMVQSEEKSLPLGVQIMGKWWDEQTMLDVAKGIEG